MNIPIRAGRNFFHDFPGDTSAVIVNEALVCAFGLKEPLGDKIRFGDINYPVFVLPLIFTLLLTFVTTGLHARRAASVNPLKNLRYE